MWNLPFYFVLVSVVAWEILVSRCCCQHTLWVGACVAGQKGQKSVNLFYGGCESSENN